MKQGIKIKSAIGGYEWYKDLEGEIFPLSFWDNGEPVVDMCNETQELGSVRTGNYDIIEFEDDEVIREKPAFVSETARIMDELETTQAALNDIIMNMMMGGM